MANEQQSAQPGEQPTSPATDTASEQTSAVTDEQQQAVVGDGVGQVPSTDAKPVAEIYAAPSPQQIEAVRRAVADETAAIHRRFSTPFTGPDR